MSRAYRSYGNAQKVTMRLEKLPAAMAKRLAELECPDFATTPWVEGKPLCAAARRDRFVGGARRARRQACSAAATPITARSRRRPGPTDLLCSHISINFDRTGFQEDWNVVFPLDRLNEMAAEGEDRLGRGNALLVHGRDRPGADGRRRREVAGKLKADKVDAVLLTSV